jgi:hypothetical protein
MNAGRRPLQSYSSFGGPGVSSWDRISTQRNFSSWHKASWRRQAWVMIGHAAFHAAVEQHPGASLRSRDPEIS